jgi:hypothetical protein
LLDTGTMNGHRWLVRKLPGDRIAVELEAPRLRTFVGLEIFPTCCRCASNYGLLALGDDRVVVAWLRAGEA